MTMKADSDQEHLLLPHQNFLILFASVQRPFTRAKR